MKVVYKKVRIKFYDRLSEFLPKKMKRFFVHKFIDQTSIKDLIESFNIPHTEVDVILINGNSVGFEYIVQNGDKIEVFPDHFRFLDTRVIHLKPVLRKRPKFICDVHLGRLVKMMRIFGIDVLYKNNYTDKEIVDISNLEKRIILTRDTGLLKRKSVRYGHYVRSNNPEKQFSEILYLYSLFKYLKPFTVCLNCGTKLKKISRKRALEKLTGFNFEKGMLFYYCRQCDQVFWQGSHFYNMMKKIQTQLKNFANSHSLIRPLKKKSSKM